MPELYNLPFTACLTTWNTWLLLFSSSFFISTCLLFVLYFIPILPCSVPVSYLSCPIVPALSPCFYFLKVLTLLHVSLCIMFKSSIPCFCTVCPSLCPVFLASVPCSLFESCLPCLYLAYSYSLLGLGPVFLACVPCTLLVSYVPCLYPLLLTCFLCTYLACVPCTLILSPVPC